MDINQFTELYNLIMSKYSWKHMYETIMDDSPVPSRKIKYFRFSLDTRDGEFFAVTFQGYDGKDVTYRLDCPESRKAMFDYLNKEDGVTG